MRARNLQWSTGHSQRRRLLSYTNSFHDRRLQLHRCTNDNRIRGRTTALPALELARPTFNTTKYSNFDNGRYGSRSTTKYVSAVKHSLSIITPHLKPVVRDVSFNGLLTKSFKTLVSSKKQRVGATDTSASQDTGLPPSISAASLSSGSLSSGSLSSGSLSAKSHGRVYVALGSNLGDRFRTIEKACQHLNQDGSVRVVETSPLYETQPMYVEDQNRFLNGVCEIQTQLRPLELLDKLQAIENDLGRVKIIDKGPRNIDLDIVTFRDETVSTERLVVPHALMLEREFVLRPLCDTQGAQFVHPESGKTASQHLAGLPSSAMPMYPLTPLAPNANPIRSLDPKRRTSIMSILNVTPDSFSDGGVNRPADSAALRATISSHIAAGAAIIDIGGQSSRPNAPDITAGEELARVLPAIEVIRSLPNTEHVTISVDTYRASVAEAAIKAGAHVINDISAGTLDENMLSTIAQLGCTYIMMHMRGTPSTMQSEENTTYPGGLIPTVASELRARLAAAQEAGIRRWRIILDPGIGFSKTVAQNLELLRDFHQLRHADGLKTFPWLVGSSRKGFIGKITGVEDASQRLMGTAATVTAAVHGGAEIVRVHDVAEMVQVVKVADGMYRA